MVRRGGGGGGQTSAPRKYTQCAEYCYSRAEGLGLVPYCSKIVPFFADLAPLKSFFIQVNIDFIGEKSPDLTVLHEKKGKTDF